jgi:hypothetical protein
VYTISAFKVDIFILLESIVLVVSIKLTNMSLLNIEDVVTVDVFNDDVLIFLEITVLAINVELLVK